MHPDNIEHVLGDNQHLIINLDGGINKSFLTAIARLRESSMCGCPNHHVDFLAGQFRQDLTDFGVKANLT